jgi:excisionase family DNA binding protein
VDKLAVSVAEAAVISGIGRTFLYEKIQRSELRSIRAGSRRLLLVKDLLEFLESLRVPDPNDIHANDENAGRPSQGTPAFSSNGGSRRREYST